MGEGPTSDGWKVKGRDRSQAVSLALGVTVVQDSSRNPNTKSKRRGLNLLRPLHVQRTGE